MLTAGVVVPWQTPLPHLSLLPHKILLVPEYYARWDGEWDKASGRASRTSSAGHKTEPLELGAGDCQKATREKMKKRRSICIQDEILPYLLCRGKTTLMGLVTLPVWVCTKA